MTVDNVTNVINTTAQTGYDAAKTGAEAVGNAVSQIPYYNDVKDAIVNHPVVISTVATVNAAGNTVIESVYLVKNGVDKGIDYVLQSSVYNSSKELVNQG